MLGTSLLLAGGLAASADSVALKGITSLFGEKMAFLVLYQPAQTQPLNFALAEGESQFGFKLLAVDAAGHRVQVEQCGVKRYLRLGNAPDVAAPANPDPAEAADQPVIIKPVPADRQAVASYLASDEVERIRAGHPVWNSAGGGAGKTAGGSQNFSPVPNEVAAGNNLGQGAVAGGSAGSSNPPGTGPAQNNYTDELWFQESMSIEQSRAMTVDEVLAGKMTPFPRTPLTPPGTPAPLVGQEVYFANYIPGFQVTGFLNQ